MSAKHGTNNSLEISSDQLQSELVEIKDRLGVLETLASISNMPVVEAYVRSHLKTDKGRSIMDTCSEPRTREQLISALKFASAQALDHHLKPLWEDDLLRKFRNDSGVLAFEWSNLFKRLPKKTIRSILDNSN